MTRHSLPLLIVLLRLTNSSLAMATPWYEIKDLTPSGYTSSVAYDINSSGDAVGVAGTYASGSLEEAYFFYDHSAGTSTVFGVGTVRPRGAIVGSGFREAAINDRGQIAGTAVFVGGSPQRRGFIYSGGVGGSFTNLGTLAGATPTGIRPESDALDINNLGIATGTATSGAGTIGSESDNIDVYTGSASPITDIDGDISKLTRYDYGRAINNAGLVVGSNQDAKATMFSGATETVLLAGTAYASDASTAIDVNESGQIAGSTNQTTTAFVYDSDHGSVTILPQIGTGSRMAAKAINESGDVVGKGDRNGGLSGQARGFVYKADEASSYILEDQVLDLSVPAIPDLSDWGSLRTAWGVNDDGWIVGVGERRFTGATFPTNRAYLLIPTTAPPNGDVDDDGDFTGADFLAWQRGIGSGLYDQDDLVDWVSNYGTGSLQAFTTTVPEPSSSALALLSTLAIYQVRRRS